MNYSRIDDLDFGVGWGAIYQGSQIDEGILDIPGPLVIVNMMKGNSDEPWLHQSRQANGNLSRGKIQAVLSVCIEDNAMSVLHSRIYLALVDSCISFLGGGCNLYIHCRLGHSRSTYLTAGIYMKLKGWSLDQTLKYIESRRKDAYPNWGFYDHLKVLELEGRFNDSKKSED